MHDADPQHPPRVAVVHEDDAVRRTLVEALALVGLPTEAHDADVLVYRLTAATLDDLRRRLDTGHPAAVALLDGPDRELMTELKALPVAAVLIAPYNAEQVAAAVDLVFARHRERAWLAAENDRLQTALNNRKLIERAKGALMKRFRWTEPEAFRRLQRGAMNRRVPMIDLARQILDGRDVQL